MGSLAHLRKNYGGPIGLFAIAATMAVVFRNPRAGSSPDSYRGQASSNGLNIHRHCSWLPLQSLLLKTIDCPLNTAKNPPLQHHLFGLTINYIFGLKML